MFQHVKGVTSTVSGYAGWSASTISSAANCRQPAGEAASTARDEEVGSGHTGHTEEVRTSYDPRQVSYGRLLQIYFWVAHDPTKLKRQGPDRFTHYRSTIFPANAEQARVAGDDIAQVDQDKTFGQPIVTSTEPLKTFYPAEAYHQDYLTLYPNQPYIVINDLPKVAALKRLFAESYRPDAALVGAGAVATRQIKEGVTSYRSASLPI